MFSAYLIHVSIIVGIYIILAVSLNLVVGYAGLLNFGHIAFFGLGAYTSVLLNFAGVPYIMSMMAGGALASVCGAMLAMLTNKLRGDYLALATLGFSFVVYAILMEWEPVTRGALGLPGIKRPSFFGLVLQTNWQYLIFVTLMVVLIVLFVNRLVHSPYGRLMGAMRDDEIGAMSLSKNVFRLKYQAMAIGAFLAGLAGSIYAHYISFIDPSSFFLSDLIVIFTIIIVGGLASLRGTIVAGIIILLLPEMLRFLSLPSSMLGALRNIFFALILLTVLLFNPRGLFGKLKDEK
ncbi:MAG: branched-chain amino acid ABC transporter permease [Candidatus Magasanikbacteria bacterium CG10_big_fil_rev_8_21_14_0_10_40_10]|uniref:Branched-chain amino acid ABC transporter permease n=1 Tax=Candidatus Magasanikbacteria bacterium CG10_big_fil_rev_8_21_14_0_10_40_10 TaxID=1974648 RepID=A0A2M6W353_9BACT|nr:MAG: branched-chain amino acid ABC transporter permease [Candidatus Magasanikbacteria bacterium CG10_big_fil_rev_8_21_14_0_10_40_10]